MIKTDDLIKNLDQQFSREHQSVYEFGKSMIGNSPTMSDIFSFQNQLLKENTANFAESQMISLNHNLSKSIIDSIN